jgi:hypothetical protein
MLTETRRAASQVDDDIKRSTFNDRDELGLSPGLLLEMEPSDGMAWPRKREIVLDELDSNSNRLKPSLVVAFAEETARVLEALRPQDQDAGERGG